MAVPSVFLSEKIQICKLFTIERLTVLTVLRMMMITGMHGKGGGRYDMVGRTVFAGSCKNGKAVLELR